MNTNNYLEQIGNVSSCYNIFTCIKEYLSKVILILEEYGSVKSNYSETIEQHIRQNFKKPITLEELSELVFVSPAYLSRVFHQDKGISIRTFINQLRIDEAKQMVLNSELPINEIATICGFPNISHFNRIFKEMVGTSPSSLRQDRKKVTIDGN